MKLGYQEFLTIVQGELNAFFQEWKKKHNRQPDLYPMVMSEDEWWDEILHYFNPDHDFGPGFVGRGRLR